MKLPSVEELRPLLGKQVRVTLDFEGPVIVSGELLHFSDDGEVNLRRADGEICFCWPLLAIEELP